MKLSYTTLLLLVFLTCAGAIADKEASHTVPFEVHNGYFVSISSSQMRPPHFWSSAIRPLSTQPSSLPG